MDTTADGGVDFEKRFRETFPSLPEDSMIKTTGQMALVTGQTVLVAGVCSFGAHSALHGFLSDADSIRPGLAVAVEHLEQLRPGPPATTRRPAPAALYREV